MFSEEMICSLNDLELEVYKYVVRNADKVCYMRIREFADAAHVSTSTILRFCKKAGCDGYAEFKIRLRQHLEQAKQPPAPAQRPAPTTGKAAAGQGRCVGGHRLFEKDLLGGV